MDIETTLGFEENGVQDRKENAIGSGEHPSII